MSRLTDVSVQVRQIRDKAIAVADGTETDFTDPRTGEVCKREKWTWLPKSMIEVDPPDYEIGSTVTVTLPETMATEKELI